MATSLSQVSPEASSLRQFQLHGVSDTGRIVGNGSYASVMELEYHGLKCVGKKIHQVLFDAATPQERAAMLQRFTEECELLSHLHHPCVVQFLGVYFEHGSQLPVLVMEFLHTTLSDRLSRYGVLPEAISYGILRDVGLGLRYLHEHSPPIVHRDLSANNVLLTTDMNGKISDLGVAKILNLTPAQMTQRMSTQAPGTPCYMPPEALMARPTYTSKIDSYSYGVLVIHVLCGRWPFPADAFRPDPQNPDVLVPVLELDRRAEYLQDIGQDHPLMGLISQCLSNAPTRRPEASEILRQITATASRVPERHQNTIEMFQHWEGQIEPLTARNQDKQSQMESEVEQLSVCSPGRERISGQAGQPGQQLRSPPQPHSHMGSQAEIEALRAEVERLSVSGQAGQPQLQPGQPLPHMESQPLLLQHQARLHWRKVASIPAGIDRTPIVVVGERVYVGGEKKASIDNHYLVFEYNPASDKWTTLPPCPVGLFGLGQLSGELLTVGGLACDGITKKVYHYKPESQQWEEFLQPMPTARAYPTVISTQSALVACGGFTGFSQTFGCYIPLVCTTVEVYTTLTSQWHTADPLPVPVYMTASATINNTAYLLGGLTTDQEPIKTVQYAPVASLIQRATSHPQQLASAARPHSTSSAWKTLRSLNRTLIKKIKSRPQQSASEPVSTSSAWKTLQNSPPLASAAASLGGMLLAVGGAADDKFTILPAVHVYSPATSTWIRVQSGDLPEPQTGCTAVELAGNRLLVVGGGDQGVKKEAVFLGSIIAV